MSKGGLLLGGVLLAFLGSCVTPYPYGRGENPLGFLPSGESLYLLVRPRGHRNLVTPLLEPITGFWEASDLERGVRKTEEMALSLAGGQPWAFSAKLAGTYPDFIIRRGFRKVASWKDMGGGATFGAPNGLVVDTRYRNTLLIGSSPVRVAALAEGRNRGPLLPEEFQGFWGDKGTAFVLYSPQITSLSLSFPGPVNLLQGSVVLGMRKEGRNYTLSARIGFPDGRALRLANLALRAYMASLLSSDLDTLKAISTVIEGDSLYLHNWSMPLESWIGLLAKVKNRES